MLHSAADRSITPARAALRTSSPPCARFRKNSAAGLRQMPAGRYFEMTDGRFQDPLNEDSGPDGDLCIRTLAMPADTNANGDIFGGWLLSQMDVGGGIFASKVAKSRTVTVAIEAMN